MKNLLVALNAKYIHSNLAVYCLSSYNCQKGIPVEYEEYTTNQPEDEILKDIIYKKPQWIGFSCYIWNIEMVTRIIRNLHAICPKLPIWVGGPEVTYDAEGFLKVNPGVTGVMCGEGEQTLYELLKAYEWKDASFSQIAGLCYRTAQEEIIRTSPRACLSLDEVPFPYDESMDLENRIMYYETSRGCPFACSYCLSSIDRHVRFRSLPLVYKELQYFLDHRVPQVKFVDRTFNAKTSHSRAIWQYIKEQDNGVTNFHFELSADLLEEADYAILRGMRPGLVQFEIGVQTTNPKTLQAIHRSANLDGIRQAVKCIHEGENIHQHLDLIAGLPYEDYKSFAHSFNDVYAMSPNQLQLGFLKVLKGSLMQEQEREFGLLVHATPPYEVLASSWLSYEDLCKLKQVEEVVEIYYNSGQFPLSIPYLVQRESNVFAFYERLGEYYARRDRVGTSHSRLQRYEILLEYAVEAYGQEISECLCQLLLFDLYQRENLKNPPSFAQENDEDRRWVQAFYRDEQRCRSFLPTYIDYQTRQIARMTHIEAMSIDVYETSRCGKEVKAKEYLLFDYQNRNALTYSAKVTRLLPEK